MKKDLPTPIHAEPERGRWGDKVQNNRSGPDLNAGHRDQGPGIGEDRCPPSPEPFHPREKPTAQRKMGVRGQGGRELVWGPIPSRLHPSKNADCRMRNGQTRSGRTRLQQIRMLWVIYITCRAAAQDLSRASQQTWEK